jgi:hypothetical protein
LGSQPSRCRGSTSQGQAMGPGRGLGLLAEAPIPLFIALYLLRPELYTRHEAFVPPGLSHPIWLEALAIWMAVGFALGLRGGLQGMPGPLQPLLWAYAYVAMAFAAANLLASLLLHFGAATAATPLRLAGLALGIATAAPLMFLPGLVGSPTGHPSLFLGMDLLVVALAWLGHRLGCRFHRPTSCSPTTPYTPGAASSSSPSHQAPSKGAP